MKSEALKETGSGGKDERTGKGKGQRAVVDLLFALVIGSAESAAGTRRRDPGSRNCEERVGVVRRCWNLVLRA